MSKQIYQFLIEDRKFRDMWADSYTEQADMVYEFKDNFCTDNFDNNDIAYNVAEACNLLESEMRQYFLYKKY